MSSRSTRRTFLKQVGIAGAGIPLAPGLLPKLPPSALDKLNIAGVGCGGKGWSDIRDTSKGQNVVAVCDVDSERLDRARQTYPDAKAYADWRKLLEQTDIDAVTISTPDHMHAPIAMAAMQLGKHVYVQKPLTHSVFEARQLLLQARRAGVVTQMGNQHRSGPHMRGARQLVRSGVIGPVREAYVWTNRPIWPQGMPRPVGSHVVPAGVAWDLWLGVAPERPYLNKVYHPFAWRGFWDFGTGALGDMGCHLMDPVVWSLDLAAPTRVTATGPEPDPDTAPAWSIVTYEFPATPARPALRLHWLDGSLLPPRRPLKMPKDKPTPGNGAMFIGEKGNLFVSDSAGPVLYPVEKFADFAMPDFGRGDHYLDWTEACKSGGATVSTFESAVPLTETVLLGNVAYRAGHQIEWNSQSLTVENDEAVAALIHRPYRRGWEVDWVD